MPAASRSATVSTASTPGRALAASVRDGGDLGMGVRRADEHGGRLPGRHDVVGVAPAAGQQPLVLNSHDCLPNAEPPHPAPPAEAAGEDSDAARPCHPASALPCLPLTSA